VVTADRVNPVGHAVADLVDEIAALKRACAQNSGMILATVGALFVFWLTLMVGLALMALMAP
jgi:hypothetical protein